MRLGAIHRVAPLAVRPLHARVGMALLTPPPAVDWHKAYPANGDALANDRLGDCVECAALQGIGMRRANAWGDLRRPDVTQAVGLYRQWGHYDPANEASDQGTDTVSAMTAWCQQGVRLDPQTLDIPRWAVVDPQDLDHVRAAIALAGPVQITAALPLAAQQTSAWALAPGTGPEWASGSWGYHRICSGKYTGGVFEVLTWGEYVTMHPEFWAKFVVAVDVTLTKDFVSGVTDVVVDWDTLDADMQELVA